MSDYGKELQDWLRLPHNVKTWIPIDNMSVGYYLCEARNFTIGYWNGTCFEYNRRVSSFTFPDTERHWDEGAPYGTCKPIRYLEETL